LRTPPAVSKRKLFYEHQQPTLWMALLVCRQVLGLGLLLV
jgi:hypothetical protein